MMQGSSSLKESKAYTGGAVIRDPKVLERDEADARRLKEDFQRAELLRNAPSVAFTSVPPDATGGSGGMWGRALSGLAKATSKLLPAPTWAEVPPRCTCTPISTPISTPLLYKRMSLTAKAPVRASAGAAGYDLAASKACVVRARSKQLVETDVCVKLPPGTYGRVAPRSGLALKHFIDVGAGVIDQDYRGTIGVLLFNHSDVNFDVKVGDRVAQLILEKIETPEAVEVAELDDTKRGAGGFGSTGTTSEAVQKTTRAMSIDEANASSRPTSHPHSPVPTATTAAAESLKSALSDIRTV